MRPGRGTAAIPADCRIENSAERHLSHGPDGSLCGDGPVIEYDRVVRA
jgi:hypothetical protein